MTTANGILDATALAELATAPDVGVPQRRGLADSFVGKSMDLVTARRDVSKRLCLWSGGAYVLPRGFITINDMGPFLSLLRWDPERLCWSVKPRIGGEVVPPFWSDGKSWRVANTVGCLINARITNRGTGYNPSNPPIIQPNYGFQSGRKWATLRATVGGAVSVSIVSGGKYDYPPIIDWNMSQQVPPYRAPTIALLPSTTASLALTTVNYAGNDSVSPRTFSGAGLNAATLSWQIIRHPDDTQTEDAVISVAAAASGQVTDIVVTDFGDEVIKTQNAEAQFTITNNGGSGLALITYKNNYLAGATIGSGGFYYNKGTTDPYSPAGDKQSPILTFASSGTGDEYASPRNVNNVASFTNGAVSAISFGGVGPGWLRQPRAMVVTPLDADCITPASLNLEYYGGADYFSYEVINFLS